MLQILWQNMHSATRYYHSFIHSLDSEAVVWRGSVKKVFLKISQNSQENSYA